MRNEAFSNSIQLVNLPKQILRKRIHSCCHAFQGELAIDARELLLKLRQSFSLSEQNGMSVVKLFTAVDKQNVGLIAFTAVRAILSKYLGTLLSTYELRILESQYAYAIDENQCR